MSLYAKRRSSLRQSLSKLLTRKSLLFLPRNRLKGRYLFRATVRLVMEFMDWIMEEPVVEEVSDDVTINIKIAREKQKVEKKLLTLEDRSILLVNPSQRSSTDKEYIYEFIKRLRAFAKFSEDLREDLAAVCIYQYLPAGRVIVRQDHMADNLYFIANGQVGLSKVMIDELTGDKEDIDMGSMQSGDMFGEVALLHTIPRTTTIISKTPVDLILITRDDFDNILRHALTKKWDVLRDALVHFNYFKMWNEETVRECCILSKLKEFEPNEILLGDATGMVNYVHFILSGDCRLIEHLLIREFSSYDGTRYELYNPETSDLHPRPRKTSNHVAKFNKSKDLDYKPSRKSLEKYNNNDRSSIITATLVNVVRKWHEITDVAAILMREPSVTSQLCYPDDIRTVFMQVCTFSRGACFGLGEQMLHRRIVAITPVRCLLIPRYWLFEHNHANIWGRVKLFLDSKYPTKIKLFSEFMQNRKWTAYKKDLFKDVVKRGRRVRSNTTIHDVPYSIRITDEIDAEM